MKFTGYAATYSPASKKANKHNYFMNGIIKDLIDENCCADMCRISKMRSLYAVADASKSEMDGTDAAFICMEMLHKMLDADFPKVCERYFGMANRAVQSRSFSNNGAAMSMDIGVIYIYQDVATAFNFGNVSIFRKRGNDLAKISGEPPKTVKIDKVLKRNDELTVEKVVKKNTPYIGHISEDFETVPYVSEQIRLKRNDSLFVATESVMSVLNQKDILDILNNDNIPQENKATAIIRKAVEKNPDENYTVQYIAKKLRMPIAEVVSIVKSKAKWIGLITIIILAIAVAVAFVIANKSDTEQPDIEITAPINADEEALDDSTDEESEDMSTENSEDVTTETQEEVPVIESKPQQATQSSANGQNKVQNQPSVNTQKPNTSTTNSNASMPNASQSTEAASSETPSVQQTSTEAETSDAQQSQSIKDIIDSW